MTDPIKDWLLNYEVRRNETEDFVARKLIKAFPKVPWDRAVVLVREFTFGNEER